MAVPQPPENVLDVDHPFVAQAGAPPLGEAYPTSRGQPGKVMEMRLALTLPADLPARNDELGLGVHRQSDLQHLDITGTETPDNMLRRGQLSVAP